MSFQLDHIQLAIPVESEDACRAYWVGILGFSELKKPEQLRARGGAWFRRGDIEIHLGVESDFKSAQKAHPAFRMSGLDDLADTLARADHPVRWDAEIAGRRRFFTDDPFGNRIEFIGE